MEPFPSGEPTTSQTVTYRASYKGSSFRDGEHDLATRVALLEVAYGLRSLAQRIDPVDDGRELAGSISSLSVKRSCWRSLDMRPSSFCSVKSERTGAKIWR